MAKVTIILVDDAKTKQVRIATQYTPAVKRGAALTPAQHAAEAILGAIVRARQAVIQGDKP